MGESADETAALVREAGGEAVVSKGDVSDWSYGEQLVKTAVAEFGQLDALVNNAGLVRDRMLVNMSEDEWDLVLKVDLKGHFVPLRHAAAYWKDLSKGGTPIDARVVNTSSGAGRHYARRTALRPCGTGRCLPSPRRAATMRQPLPARNA